MFTAACGNKLAGLHGPPGSRALHAVGLPALPARGVRTRHAPNLLRLKAFFAREFQLMPVSQFIAVFGRYASARPRILRRFPPRCWRRRDQSATATTNCPCAPRRPQYDPSSCRGGSSGRSPFAGQAFVHVLAGLRMAPGAQQQAFHEGVWDLTGASDVSVQVAPNILHWDFTKIEHKGWRLVARELMIAVLAPGHKQVLTLPLARRDPLAPATCHSKLSAVTAWFQWLSGQGIQSLEQVTQDHCDRYLQQRQGDGLHSAQ